MQNFFAIIHFQKNIRKYKKNNILFDCSEKSITVKARFSDPSRSLSLQNPVNANDIPPFLLPSDSLVKCPNTIKPAEIV